MLIEIKETKKQIKKKKRLQTRRVGNQNEDD